MSVSTHSSESIRDARARYFRESGFAQDGGYADRWVKLKIGRRAVLAFPNTASRVRSVKLHDVHHVLTGYATTWTGESEIGAWEIASGCGHHHPAWLLNFGAFAIGLVIAPKKVFRAFVRGRRSGNLYRGEFDESLLDRTVGDLCGELPIATDARFATPREITAFALWCAASVIVTLTPYAVVALLLILGVRSGKLDLTAT